MYRNKIDILFFNHKVYLMNHDTSHTDHEIYYRKYEIRTTSQDMAGIQTEYSLSKQGISQWHLIHLNNHQK